MDHVFEQVHMTCLGGELGPVIQRGVYTPALGFSRHSGIVWMEVGVCERGVCRGGGGIEG